MDSMTTLSRHMFDKASSINSLSEAVELLESYSQFRSLSELLCRFSGSEDPVKLLTDGMKLWDSDASPESTSKKVRNWLSGKTKTVNKLTALRLSRVLHLDLERTDEFLRMLTGEGLHLRDPEEIVWAYSAVHDYDPGQHAALQARLAALGAVPKPAMNFGVESYTEEVEYGLRPLLYAGEEELMAYLAREWDKLGSFHNMGYMLFTQLMELLEQGYSEHDAEALMSDRDAAKPRTYSVVHVLEHSMYRRLIPFTEHIRKNQKSEKSDLSKKKNSELAFSAVQRAIRDSWPDEFVISRMKKRQVDVTRKVLILLFLATDGSGSDYEDLRYQDEALSREELFMDMYIRMNVMLRSCGFQSLDPRSPFDWLILFCLSTGDEWEIDQRMQEMLEKLFPAETESESGPSV